MKTASRSLPLGAIIHGRYEIRKEIGEGGFGITYQVWDRKEQQIAAMKEFMPREVANRRIGSSMLEAKPGQQNNYERFRKKFLDEAQLLYQYRTHPNIVEVKHLFCENNTAYYVMEYLEGMDFGKLLRMWGSKPAWERLVPILSQAAAALEAIHKGGLVHCDISPDNIFVLSDGTVKLIDFGAVKNFVKGPSSVIYLKNGYAPPEQQISNGKIGPWTDVYAFGVVIYIAYTGKMPPDAMARMTDDQLLMPSRMGMSPPSNQWEQALQKALALRPEERYQDVGTFWKELNNGNYQRKVPVIEGIKGYYQGRVFFPEQETLLGTDVRRCHIGFPAGSEGISRVHLRCWCDGEQLMAMDMGSTYGSFLNQKPMTPGLVYCLSFGDVIQIGRQELFRASATEIS